MSTYANSWTLVDSITTEGTSTSLQGVKSGYAKICLKDQIGGIRVNVYNKADETLILNSVFIGNNSCLTFDANPYMDSTNNNGIELLVVTTRTPISSYTLELWD